MARKELRTGLLAYNLIRQTMLQAAIAAGRSPRDLSFTVAMQTIAAAWMVAAVTEEHQELLVQLRLEHMASHRVGHRPNRIEPRAVKRRPKPHDLLMEPRDQARETIDRRGDVSSSAASGSAIRSRHLCRGGLDCRAGLELTRSYVRCVLSLSAGHAIDSEQVSRPPQFGLRALLLMITAISVVLAVFMAIGPMWSAMLALAFSLIGLHIAGNAIGTRLREHAPRRQVTDAPVEVPPPTQAAPELPAARRLQEATAIDGRCWLIAAMGVVLGATLGGICVWWLADKHLTVAGLLVGVLSSAVLGGLFSFMASSFFLVARTAWREALQALDESPPATRATIPSSLSTINRMEQEDRP